MHGSRRISHKLFSSHPKYVAGLLLGKYLVRKLPEGKIVVKIVETEAYGGKEDDGCHVGRYGRTKRTERLFGKVGYSYVYPVHINTYCLNIVCHQPHKAGGILLRACEPVEGLNLILKNLNKDKNFDITKLLNGPGKVCKALKIDKTLNGIDMLKENSQLYLTEGEKIKKSEILKTQRINIDYAKKSKNWLWRFIIKNSKFISR
ncbi:MAG: DNA-3-methyladenine glycosylase [Endomicrobiia bacterium]